MQIINSKHYADFKQMHDKFDGQKVKINDENIENSLNYQWNESEVNELYNRILESDYADFYDKIVDLQDNFQDLKHEMISQKITNDRLNDENMHFKKENHDLKAECEKLQEELDEIKSSKLWKLKNKF